MLQKFIIFLTLSTLWIQAEQISANYQVSYGVLGKIGVAEALLERKDNQYTIDVNLSATGVAKALSQVRRERHISKGHILNGMLVSDSYSVKTSHGKTVKEKIYTFDHKNKTVKKVFRKFKRGKETRHEEDVLEYYSQDDLLTFYFNMDKKFKDKTTPCTYIFQAVGAERQEGNITMKIPDSKTFKSYKKSLDMNASWCTTAVIHQDIFSTDEGVLILNMGKDGIPQEAVLKDVTFFGDIHAVRTK